MYSPESDILNLEFSLWHGRAALLMGSIINIDIENKQKGEGPYFLNLLFTLEQAAKDFHYKIKRFGVLSKETVQNLKL